MPTMTTPAPVMLSSPCWWIDRNDCWEITHHRTVEDAVANHRDRVCGDHGWILSVAGAFAIVPGEIQQEPRRCYEAVCPGCGEHVHLQYRYDECVECGHEFVIDTLPAPDDEHQEYLFEILETTGIPGKPGLAHVIVMFMGGED